MKLINSRFAASTCLLTLLAAPASVLAQKATPVPVPFTARVPEPSTLAMTLVGLGIGMGVVVATLRRKRSSSAAQICCGSRGARTLLVKLPSIREYCCVPKGRDLLKVQDPF
jgi:hypothetical protein